MTQHCLQDWMELAPITEGHLMNSESLLICMDQDCNLLLHDTCFSKQIVSVQVTSQNIFLEDEDIS